MDNLIKPEGQTTSDNFSLSDDMKNVDFEPQSLWGELSYDDAQYIRKKGVKTPTDLLHSYRELEKSYSSRVSLPQDGDEEALHKFYSRLGMPDDVNGFELKLAEEDKPLADGFKQVCMSAHILPKSAQTLYDWFVQHRHSENEKAEQMWLEQTTAEFDEQKKSWGAKAPFCLEQMKRGIRLFAGDDDNAVSQIEQALGTKRMMQIFARLGEAVSEDNPISFGNASDRKKGFDAEAFYREMFNDY